MKDIEGNKMNKISVICDGCECSIHGYRFTCSNCDDFDFCQECENKKTHIESHVFISKYSKKLT
jgi:hypothetical protein